MAKLECRIRTTEEESGRGDACGKACSSFYIIEAFLLITAKKKEGGTRSARPRYLRRSLWSRWKLQAGGGGVAGQDFDSSMADP
jgi:hypothetical protein